MFEIITAATIFLIFYSFLYALSMVSYHKHFCFDHVALRALFGPRKKRPAGSIIVGSDKFITETFLLNLEGKYLRGQLFLTPEKSEKWCFVLQGFNRTYSQMEIEINEFIKMGFNVVAFDYLGCGLSDGKTTTLGYREADQLKQVYDFISNKFTIKEKIIFGHSMGGITSLWFSKKFKTEFDVYFLESVYTSLQDTIKTRLKNSGLGFLPLSNLMLFWATLLRQVNFFKFNLNFLVSSDIGKKAIFLHGVKDQKSDINLILNKIRQLSLTTDQLISFEDGKHESLLSINSNIWRSKIIPILRKL